MEKVNCEKYTNLLQFLKRNDAIIFYMSQPLAWIYLKTCKSQICYIPFSLLYKLKIIFQSKKNRKKL